MLRSLDEPVDLREIDLSDKPEEFLELSPTGKVPLLADGEDFVLYESRIINDYLVDELDWADAYPSHPRDRARQRLVMKQFDDVILGPVYRSLSDDEALPDAREEVEAELDVLEEVLGEANPRPDSLIGFHLAPFWARFCWLEQYTDFPDLVRNYDELSSFLERAVNTEPIQATLPDKDQALEAYRTNYVEVD